MKNQDHVGIKNSPVGIPGISFPMIPARRDHVRIRVGISPITQTV